MTDESDPARPQVRIFTPARELPLRGSPDAGHGLGTHPRRAPDHPAARGRSRRRGLRGGPGLDGAALAGTGRDVSGCGRRGPCLASTPPRSIPNSRLSWARSGSASSSWGLASVAELEGFTLRPDQFAALPAEHLFLFARDESPARTQAPELRYRARMFLRRRGPSRRPRHGQRQHRIRCVPAANPWRHVRRGGESGGRTRPALSPHP